MAGAATGRLAGTTAVVTGASSGIGEATESGPRQVADLVNISSIAGRQVRLGSGVYNATKQSVGAFSEARTESPGNVTTEAGIP